MEAHEVLQKAIPENEATKVAKFLSISGSLVSRWRRRPPEDDDPNATGQRSILDRICELIDVCFLINPRDCGLIVQFIVGHYRELMKKHAAPLDCQTLIVGTVDTILTEAKEAAVKLVAEGCTAGTLQELVQLRDAADSAIERVQKTMSAKDEETNP